MIRSELIIFLIVGGLTTLIDFFSYYALIGFNIFDISIAKAAGFMIGTLFAYFANRFWTFNHKSYITSSPLRFVVLYGVTLEANLLVNSFALKLFANNIAAIQLAFLVATGVSACLNFLGMKFFVFRARSILKLK